MKLIRTEDAVGQVLCHDITQIIPGVVKDAVFRKGHIVTKEDIPVLLSVGKEHLYVWEKKEGILHEDEAAVILRDLCINDNMTASEPKEGKIEIRAAADGLLKINSEKLRAVNGLGEMMIATIHGNFPVKAGDRLAATRIIPLVIEEEKMKKLPYTDSHWTGSVNRCLYVGTACTDEQAEAFLASRTKSRIPERKRLLRPFRDRL